MWCGGHGKRDRVSAGGGCEAVVSAKTKCESVTLWECGCCYSSFSYCLKAVCQ